eukprot:IDg2468t1
MHHRGVAKRFWAEALSTAVYVRNRVTSRSLSADTTPHHIWHGTPPDVSRMRVFGSKCWYVIPQSKVRKLDARSKEAMMVGYAAQSKGYKLWDQDLGKFVISRDVKFDENGDSTVSINAETSEIDTPKVEDVTESRAPSPESEPTADNDDEERYSTPTQEDPQVLQSAPQVPPRRTTRVSKPPGEWWKAPVLSARYSNNSALAARVVPTSYKVATSPENIEFWGPGIAREEDAIARNNTFDLVQREPWMNVIQYKYLFKVKIDSPKVRIVAMGCHQVHGVDYTETFAPVVKLTSIRIFLATVAVMDLETGQMDVITAFLNGDLDEDIYMEVPDGFKDPKCRGLVCKLRKALYGLKQAPRQWYAKIHDFLVNDLGFASSPNDPCMYSRHSSSSFMLIALYVDDMLIAAKDSASIAQIKGEFSRRFEMKDLGEASVCLGLEIHRNRANRTLHLSQKSYTNTVLER